MKDEKSKITAVAIEKMIDFYQGKFERYRTFPESMGVCKDDRGAGKCG